MYFQKSIMERKAATPNVISIVNDLNSKWINQTFYINSFVD